MINLDGRRFSPVSNSHEGRVKRGAVFLFTQSGAHFTARYHGAGVTDGHIIGHMTGQKNAELIYHARAENGALEAGQAAAIFDESPDGKLSIAMDWQWLNGSKASGKSLYREL